jgi:hypothetical protein
MFSTSNKARDVSRTAFMVGEIYGISMVRAEHERTQELYKFGPIECVISYVLCVARWTALSHIKTSSSRRARLLYFSN